MKKGLGYIEHEGKVIVPDKRFKHIMAITLDQKSQFKEGVVRCITSRDGDIRIKGNKDRSRLYKIHLTDEGHFAISDELHIEDPQLIISGLIADAGPNADFLGLEDPDIWVDPATNLTHLYFTIPIIPAKVDAHYKKMLVHLGHAVGKNIDSLTMTEPALIAHPAKDLSAKELSVTPVNSRGLRYNLIESHNHLNNTTYSTIQIAIAKDMSKPWIYGECIFHPAQHDIAWIGGHASPGPFFSKSFIDVGKNKVLGIINGREVNTKIGEEIKYGMFSIGLFIYDYELGKIDWVSPRPFIIDSQAENITFASQFVETKPGIGILYAHVDDSFVRAYTLNAMEIKKILP